MSQLLPHFLKDGRGKIDVYFTRVFNPVWTTVSNPDDTLSTDLVYTFQPTASDVYVITGTENVSGCVQQYFFSVELGDPPATNIVAPPSVCA